MISKLFLFIHLRSKLFALDVHPYRSPFCARRSGVSPRIIHIPLWRLFSSPFLFFPTVHFSPTKSVCQRLTPRPNVHPDNLYALNVTEAGYNGKSKVSEFTRFLLYPFLFSFETTPKWRFPCDSSCRETARACGNTVVRASHPIERNLLKERLAPDCTATGKSTIICLDELRCLKQSITRRN